MKRATGGEKNVIKDAMGSGYGTAKGTCTAKEVLLKSDQVHTFPKTTVTCIRKGPSSVVALELPSHNVQSCFRQTERKNHSSCFSPPPTSGLSFLKILLLTAISEGWAREKRCRLIGNSGPQPGLSLEDAGSEFLRDSHRFSLEPKLRVERSLLTSLSSTPLMESLQHGFQ